MDVMVDSENLKILRLCLGIDETNAYIVVCPQTGDSALVDVPPGARTIVKHLKGTNLKYMLLTHNHIDHVGGLRATRDRVRAPLAVHPNDIARWLPLPPEIRLNDGDVIKIGKVQVEALYTPGHTLGSMCFRIGKYLLAGDTLFPDGPGRTVSPSDFVRIVKSITEKIFVLPGDTVIYPGHGEPAVLGKEREKFAVFSSREHPPGLCGDVVWLSS